MPLSQSVPTLGQPYIDPTQPHPYEKSTVRGRCNWCYGKRSDPRHS